MSNSLNQSSFKKLVFRELVILKMVDEWKEDRPITQYQLVDPRYGDRKGLVNEFIKEINEPAYAEPISSINFFLTALAKLRVLGLLENEKKIRITDEGRKFVKKLGKDWRKWPILIPIENDRLIMKEARYSK